MHSGVKVQCFSNAISRENRHPYHSVYYNVDCPHLHDSNSQNSPYKITHCKKARSCKTHVMQLVLLWIGPTYMSHSQNIAGMTQKVAKKPLHLQACKMNTYKWPRSTGLRMFSNKRILVVNNVTLCPRA